ncbi:MAG: pentapeptide repeat-containing protein [Limisphaerales bacterium]
MLLFLTGSYSASTWAAATNTNAFELELLYTAGVYPVSEQPVRIDTNTLLHRVELDEFITGVRAGTNFNHCEISFDILAKGLLAVRDSWEGEVIISDSIVKKGEEYGLLSSQTNLVINVDFKIFDSVLEQADFRGITFGGTTIFGHCHFVKAARFGETKFSSNLIFSGTTFSEAIDFGDARFTNDVHFSGIFANKRADFHKATFLSSASFDNAKFKESANFRGSTFSEEAYFRNGKFNKANFRAATFVGSADFGEAIFGESGFDSWTNACFNKTAYFNNAKFTNSFFKGVTFKGNVSFNDADFWEVGFSHVDFQGLVEICGAHFYHLPEDYFGFPEPFSDRFAGILFTEVNFNSARFITNKFDCQVAFVSCVFSNGGYFYKNHFSAKTEFFDNKFLNDADFSGTLTDNNLSFTNIEFSGSFMLENADCHNLSFNTINFHEGASFRNLHTRDSVLFNKVKFGGDVSFKDAADNSYNAISLLQFHDVHFSGRADFEGLQLAHLDFRGGLSPATFEREAHFQKIRVKVVDFDGAEFQKDCHFELADITNRLTFTNVFFQANLNLNHAQLPTRLANGKTGVFVDSRTLINGALILDWEQLEQGSWHGTKLIDS